MKKTVLVVCILAAFGIWNQSVNAQDSKNPNIVLITLDGLRWQELFTGADPLLTTHEDYVHDVEG
ncbi:MAG: phosphoglyceromutase, partial [Maribacter sp.]|nr:phosphoglyceromutase [Maribacter sp.]